ncbi:VanZ family protein [Oceanobacillus chungangensis]|uniref:VanZ family protein n=1 Tax=Oceanobacillus chungangensis TaxID=1229152 RepID=A0A3D8PXN5_9BACI|nr:VanZ family protein [Oceanobacillus chungangensis]RDW19645.1 VanZ family protein [Oceanobacillus chungangensis]
MDKKIETYINQIVSQLNCDEDEKREIIDEMQDHLTLLKNEYLDQGFTEEEATQKALISFGEQKPLAKGLQASLFPFYKVSKKGTWILFSLYSFIILFMLLFERIIIRMTDYYINGITYNRYITTPLDSEGISDFLKYNSNFIPFKNTIGYLNGTHHVNTDIIINNTLGNILLFLPLGIFLPLLFKKCSRFMKVMVASTIISFTIEILQIVLKIGRFDIDDVILNVIGGIIGFLLLKMIKSVITFYRKLQIDSNEIQ